jgi:integrase
MTMSSLKKLPDGRYLGRYRGPDGREHVKRFKRKNDCQKWLDDVTVSVATGSYVAPQRGRMTVGTWGESWLAGRVDLKPKTASGYASLWSSQIAPVWERVPLAAITNADIAAWVAKMRADGLSASRTRQAFHLFGATLADAVADRRLASNPAAGVRLPKMPRAENRYLTHGEVEQLAVACGNYGTLIRVLAYSGLRFGEAVGLRVRRVDVVRGRLDIAESVTEVGGVAVTGTPKTHQRRSVPVPAFLRPALLEAVDGKPGNAYVFTAVRGGVLRVGSFRRGVWNPACIAVGLGEMVKDKDGRERYVGLTPHDLRHAAASFAIASGASVKAVQSMLGHASATQTLDRYAALFGDELDGVAERMDAARAADFSRTSRGPKVVAIAREAIGT